MHTWPKCGPPNYFCGPSTFFTTRNLVKNFTKSIQRTIKAEIVTLSSLIWNSAAGDEKLFSNLARDQKSVATPDIEHTWLVIILSC